jgi:integrase
MGKGVMELTDKLCRETPAPTDKPFVLLWDEKRRGLALRITRDNGGESGNVRSWVFFYRRGSQQRSHTIGRFSDYTVAEARAEAKKLRHQVDGGGDPQKQRSEYNKAPTVNELLDRYIEVHLPKKRASSRRDDEAMIKQYLRPELGTSKVHEVEHDDIDKLHRKITEHAPIRANRVLSLASKVFNLAIKSKMRTDNPCKGVARNPENRRERYLTPDEMKRLAAALAKHDRPTANVVRLALLTGARRGELLKMRWQEIDFAQGKWTKPSAHTKQKKTHHLYLSPPALALLVKLAKEAQAKRGQKRIGRVEIIPPGQVVKIEPAQMPSPYVFPARGDDDEPQTELKKFWATICKEARLDEASCGKGQGVRFHDLRHQHASMIASTVPGASLMLIGQLLGHTQAQTTQRYAHLFPDTQRQAVDSVGAAIEALEVVEPERPAKGRRRKAS